MTVRQPKPSRPATKRVASCNVVAIVQARMGSSRLPGKTLVDIAGKPLLAHVVERVQASARIERLVIATTSEADDAKILGWAAENGVPSFAGSRDDVLDRFYQAAQCAAAEIIVRITADDPFKDPDVIDAVVDELISDSQLSYASNTIVPTFPEGLDVEAFRFSALARAWREAHLASDREHVTPYIWRNPALFFLKNIRYQEDLSSLRWTLDYEEDLEFTRRIYSRLYRGRIFKMQQILDLLREEPELARINSGVPRNAGYLLSLQREQQAGSRSSA